MDRASLQSVRIRRIQAHDAPKVVAAIDAVCAEGIYLLTERYRTTPEWEAVLRRPQETSGCLLLVPVIDGRVIGWCRAFAGPFAKVRHVADVGIGLLAPYREQGIGTMLMQRVLCWAGEQGLEKLTADTFASNARARALLCTAGFVETGVRRRQYKVEGQYVDQILLERLL